MLTPLLLEIPAPIVLPIPRKIFKAFQRHRRGLILLLLLVFGLGTVGCHIANRASQLNPIFYGPDLKSFKALGFYELGAFGRAGELYRADFARALEHNDQMPAILRAILLRKFSEARQLAEHDLLTDPENIDALLGLAQIESETGDFQQAQEHVRRVLAIYSDNTDALLLAALIATRDPSQGDPIDSLNSALRTGKAARNLISFLNTLEIIAHLKSKSRSERPYGLLTHYYRVLRIYDTGMTDHVIKTAHRAIRKGDHVSEAYLSIGLMYEKLGEPDRALQAYQEAVRVQPAQALGYYWASQIYWGNRDGIHTYLLLKKAVQASPQDSFYSRALYRHFVDLHEYFGLKHIMSSLVQTHPDNVSAAAYLAVALHNLGDKQSAHEISERVMKLEAQGPSDLELQAWAAGITGQEREEESLLRRSIKLDHASPSGHKALARAYKKQQKINESLEEFEVASSMDAYSKPEEVREFCVLYRASSHPDREAACLNYLSSRFNLPRGVGQTSSVE